MRNPIATLKIFVSFEYDKDNELKNNFIRQAKEHTQYKIENHSLNEVYHDKYWKGKARNAIRQCDVVVVLIGQDTHNAPGVKVETDMARSLNKPIIQVKPRKRSYHGLPHLGKPILWRWELIIRKIEGLQA